MLRSEDIFERRWWRGGTLGVGGGLPGWYVDMLGFDAWLWGGWPGYTEVVTHEIIY